MLNFFRRNLFLKLFLSYLLVVLLGIGILFAAVRLSLPAGFNRHQNEMQQMMGGGMGMGSGGMGRGMGAPLLGLINVIVNDAVLAAAAAAVLAAAGISAFVSYRITRPLKDLSAAAQRIAAGHYNERVPLPALPEPALDDLGRLALRFNQMAAALDQTETVRRQLIADVSHELRTPLTTIAGSMEGLIDGVLPPDPATFEQLRQDAARLQRLVEDLQELSRVEAGAVRLQPRPCAPADLLQPILRRFTPAAEARGITLALQLPAALPAVLADPDRITQVLTNLVDNAFKFTPPGGQVTLSAAAGARFTTFSVADTGAGIPADQLEQVFTRFYRVEKSRSRAHGGSGIGLTIARSLVEAHGGEMRAASPGPGQGALFTFTLPNV